MFHVPSTESPKNQTYPTPGLQEVLQVGYGAIHFLRTKQKRMYHTKLQG